MDFKTIQAYDALAKEYDAEVEPFWTEFPQEFLSVSLNHLKGSVLDVGSGSGRDGLILKNAGLRVSCIDASSAMVDMCKEKGLEAVQADFAKIPFADFEFDNAWMYTSLLHVPKAEAPVVLSEVKRVIKHKGMLVLGLIEGDVEGYKNSAGMNMPRWFSFYKKEEVEKLLADAGFEIVFYEEFMPRSKKYLNFLCRKK